MSLENLEACEKKVLSQNGEDGVIEAIFAEIGVTNKYFVEFGCQYATQCNTANLLLQGWNGLLMDGDCVSRNPMATVYNEFITAENIDSLLRKYDVPQAFDLLSIDVDGNDFWIWKQIVHRPRVVVIEYNADPPPNVCCTIQYEPNFVWYGTTYFGASLLALARLGRVKGYTLVHCERAGVNAFFIADEALPQGYTAPSIETIYRPPNYKYQGKCFRREPTRMMIDPFADGDKSSASSG
jgi:hypothetical protein